jgi:L-seryl-tRNA(Ser) seleniumtransferase
LADLVALGRKHHLPVIDDIGSGALVDFAGYGFPREPVAPQSIKSGADLVLFSGDKLLGGPQCGVIVGRRDLVQKVARHPMSRALRVGKLTLAALTATLRLYRDPEAAEQAVPLLALLTTPLDNLKNRAERLAPQIADTPAVATARPVEDTCQLGGGSVPSQNLPTWCVAVQPAEGSVSELARSLRVGTPAVVGRVKQDQLLIDLRTVLAREDIALVEAFAALKAAGATEQAS